MHIHVYVTTEKYEFELGMLDRERALHEALQRAKAGRGVPVPSDCRYLALLPDEEHLKLRQVHRGS